MCSWGGVKARDGNNKVLPGRYEGDSANMNDSRGLWRLAVDDTPLCNLMAVGSNFARSDGWLARLETRTYWGSTYGTERIEP